MKRKGFLGGIFAMALILVLTLVLSVGSVSAAEPTIVGSGNCGKDGSNVTWTLDSTGFLTISGTGEMADYQNSSSRPWYGNSLKITKVEISDGVTSIGDSAFIYCKGLISVTIPDSVTSIGDYAFNGCTNLAEAEIPNGLINIGNHAFDGCTGLTSAVVPDNVTVIGESAFDNCTGLKSVTIGSGVTTMGYSAFNGCTGLTEINYNAKRIEEVQHAFENAGTSSGEFDVIFGKSVEKIPNYIFDGCAAMTCVTIGSNVTSIGDSAFRDCVRLTIINYNAKEVTNIEGWSDIFKNAGESSNKLKVVVGDSVEKIPGYLFKDCTGLTNVDIPDNVTVIGESAFDNCTGLKSVTIGSGVTTMGYSAFNGCTGLTEINYNAKRIEEVQHAFENAGTSSGGFDVVFGKNVEKIPDFIFYDCTGLTSVTIGSNVTNIGCGAFSGCTGLTSVEIPNSVTNIGGSAFQGCTRLTSVGMPNSITCIEQYAFSGCTGLTNIEIPEHVIDIGTTAFSDCIGLTKIYYNAKTVECSLYAVFENAGIASGGMEVVFGENVKKIPSGLFRGCTGLTDLTIGSNVTDIESDAFYNCEGLTNVTIPDSVTSIGNCAFYGCINLTEVIYNAKAAADMWDYDNRVFAGSGTTSSGMKVIIGENVKKIPAYLFCNAKNIRSFIFTGNPPTVGSSAFRDNYAYALYPVHNSEWTKSAREACGSHLTWIGYCTEPVSSAACRVDQTAYLPNDTLNTQGLCMTLTHKDGCTETIPYDSGLLELGGCDMSTPGAKTIDVTYRGTTAQLKIYVHERKTQTLDKKGYPESSHNYENNLDKTYTYKAAGAVSLDVTFSAQTEVETNIDYLYVNGAQYTGTELAGKTISIQGDTLIIRLVSDKSDSAYGFSIDRIVKTYMEHQYKNGVCTRCGAKDPNYKLTAPSVKTDYLISTGKPYIKWAAVAGASKYEVYRSGSKDGSYTLLGTTTATNYTDNKANAGYIYYYKVKAVNANSIKSDYSATVAATCHCARPDVKPDYLISTGKPYIKWTAVAGASKYYVYRSGSSNGTYKYVGTTTATNYTDNKANAGYTYYYKVKAVSKVSSGANSYYSVVIGATCHCARPSVKITTSNGSPKLTWNAVAGASQYEVYRATSKNGSYTKMFTTSNLSYTNTSAKAGTTYYYKVKAVSKVKSTANSAFSTVVSIRAR